MFDAIIGPPGLTGNMGNPGPPGMIVSYTLVLIKYI